MTNSLSFEPLESRVVLSVMTPMLGIGDNDVVFNSSVVADSVAFSVDGSGLLEHNLGGTNGFNSNVDLDSVTAGDQTRMVSALTSLTYNDAGNNDTVSFATGNAFNFSNAGFTALSVTAGNIVMNSGSSITTVDGSIMLRANQGSTPIAGDFAGIELDNADITSTTGDVLLEGRGGDETAIGSGFNHGILIDNGSQVRSIGTTKANATEITLVGTGGDTEFGISHGVIVRQPGSSVNSIAGNISITGAGGPGSTQNLGVVLSGGATVTSTGTLKTDAATIKIDGSGGNGMGFTHAVLVTNLGSKVSSIAGDIEISGQGGFGTGTNNIGVFIRNGAVVESIGTTKADAAKIDIDGTGGNVGGSGRNYGVNVAESGSRVSSVAGDISITGQGGGNGTGNANIGVLINGGLVESTGTSSTDAASITITGSGGDGFAANYGVRVDQVGSRVSSATGDITVIGQGGGSGTLNAGVFINVGGVVESTGAGNIDVAGTGSAVGRGVYVVGASSIQTAGGNIDVTGMGAGGTASIEATGIDAGSGVVDLTAPTGLIREAEAGIDVIGSNVNFSGGVAPAGTSATGQIMIDGDVTYGSSVDYNVELNGLTAVTDYDQVQVIGTGRTVDLSGASLSVNLGFTPAEGDEFVVVDNVDSTSTVNGTFAGLPQGQAFSVGATVFHVFYNAGTDNNDVVLIVNRAPDDPLDIDAADNEVAEGADTDTVVGITAFASDPDGDTVTYSLTDDAGGRFKIDGNTGVVTVNDGSLLDFETDTSHNITVEASDGIGGASNTTFTINVLDRFSFVDADNDGAFNSGAGDVALGAEVTDGEFDTDEAEGNYTSVIQGAGLVLEDVSIVASDIDFRADGYLRVNANLTANDDMELESDDKSVLVDAMLTADDELEIEAEEDIFVSASSILTATDSNDGEIELEAERDIDVSGATLIAGDEIELEADGDIFAIGTTLQALGNSDSDVELEADGNVNVSEANIAASDDVEIESDEGDIIAIGTTLQALGNSDSDVELEADGNVNVSGANIAASDDVEIESDEGDIIANDVVVQAGDEIELEADGDVIAQLAQLEANGSDGEVEIEANGYIDLAGAIVRAFDEIEIESENGDVNLTGASLAILDGSTGGDIEIEAETIYVQDAEIVAPDDIDLDGDLVGTPAEIGQGTRPSA